MIDGARLEERMEAAGLSQSELARRVGVSQQGIHKLIVGTSRRSLHTAKIARELGTSVEYLEGETDDPANGVVGEILSAEERDWLSAMRGLPSADREAVLRLTQSLARDV